MITKTLQFLQQLRRLKSLKYGACDVCVVCGVRLLRIFVGIIIVSLLVPVNFKLLCCVANIQHVLYTRRTIRIIRGVLRRVLFHFNTCIYIPAAVVYGT